MRIHLPLLIPTSDLPMHQTPQDRILSALFALLSTLENIDRKIDNGDMILCKDSDTETNYCLCF